MINIYAAYCRVSSEEQAKNETIDAQIDVLNDYFSKQSINVPEELWYIDDGVSGELMLRDRPDGARMLLDAVEGKFNHLVVVRVNRIAREDYAAQEAFHTLKKCGVSLISLSEPFNYFEPSGQMMATVFSSFAAYDRATIKQNFAAGKARKAKRGKMPQGSIPYGYKIADDQTVEINPEQAEIVRMIYKLYIEDSMSLRAITEYLTSMNVPAPADYKGNWYRNHKRSGGWCEYTVNNILKSDIYTGIYPYKPPGQQPIPVPIPEIIDSESYFKARIIASNKRRDYAPNGHYREYLLRGLIQCGVCGSSYVGSSTEKGKFTYYRCTKKKATSSDPCHNPSIRADIIEELVWEDVCKTFRRPDILAQEIRKELENNTVAQNDTATEITDIDRRVIAITTEKKRLLDLYAKGAIVESELVSAINERGKAMDTLLERKNFLSQQVQIQQKQADEINSLITIAGKIHEILENADEKIKRYLFETLIDRIEIHPAEKPILRIFYTISSGLLSECHLVR